MTEQREREGKGDKDREIINEVHRYKERRRQRDIETNRRRKTLTEKCRKRKDR